MAEVGIARHEFLFDYHGMTEAAGGIAKFEHTEAAITIVDTQNGDALEAEFGIDVAR
jgi:hypothetical protein